MTTAPLSKAVAPPAAAPQVPAEAAPTSALLVTLAALALSMAPYVQWLPWWSSASIAALFMYRALVALGRVRPLANTLQTLLMLLLLVACSVGLQHTFGTLAGRDGGGGLLMTLLGLKVVETRTRRDLYVLGLLGFFVLITHFFFVQETFTALYALLCMAALCAGLMLSERPGLWPDKEVKGQVGQQAAPDWQRTRQLLRPAGLLLLQALPLTIALFVLFPRPSNPLWQMPVSSKTASSSGLTDHVDPGSITSLALSDEVAFRAEFTGAAPPPSQLYWRGPVLETFDGSAWSMAPMVRTPIPQTQVTVTRTSYSYTLSAEATGQPWVLALDVPTTLPAGTRLTRAMQLIKPDNIGARTLFKLTAAPVYRYGQAEDARVLDYNLLLPQNPNQSNPKVQALARTWQSLPPLGRVQAALNMFHTGHYAYTLQPPALPKVNGLDTFVFESKRGFCEHYASAFTLMMRAAGVPARVVTGYQGAEYNSGYLIVRQANAHAWSEVWLQGRGWVRVDPTAAIDPARIERGVGSLRGAPGLAGDSNSLFKALSLRLDALQNAWNMWVIGYDGNQQKLLFKMLGLGDFGSLRLVLFSVLALLLAALPLLLRRQQRPEPLVAAYALLERRLKLPRQPQETPTQYLQRAKEAYPQRAADLSLLLGHYERLRYGPAPKPDDVQQFIRAVQAFRP